MKAMFGFIWFVGCNFDKRSKTATLGAFTEFGGAGIGTDETGVHGKKAES